MLHSCEWAGIPAADLDYRGLDDDVRECSERIEL
jgi:hypothetical protein